MANLKLFRISTVPISLAGLLRGQHRYMTQQGFEVVGVSSSEKWLEEVSNSEGIRTEAVEMTRTLSLIKDLKSLWQFYRLCKKEKPTIECLHIINSGVLNIRRQLKVKIAHFKMLENKYNFNF